MMVETIAKLEQRLAQLKEPTAYRVGNKGESVTKGAKKTKKEIEYFTDEEELREKLIR